MSVPSPPRILLGLFVLLLSICAGEASGRSLTAEEDDISNNNPNTNNRNLNPDIDHHRWSSSENALPWRPPALSSKDKEQEEDPPPCVLDEDHFELLDLDEVVELVLNDTLVVDGCTLDCNAVRFESLGNRRSVVGAISLRYGSSNITFSAPTTATDPSILAVRNGGVVRSCRVGLRFFEAPKNGGESRYESSDSDDEWSPKTPFPYGDAPNDYTRERMTVSGVRCDSGDCFVDDVGCIGFRGFYRRYSIMRDKTPILSGCLEATHGAGDVRIRGAHVPYTVSAHGIFVNATANDNKDDDSFHHNSNNSSNSTNSTTAAAAPAPTMMRLFVDNTTIANQYRDGVTIIAGGAIATIRIADTHLEGNGRDGMRLQRFDDDDRCLVPDIEGLEHVAILRSSFRFNKINGIGLVPAPLMQYQPFKWRGSDSTTTETTKIFVSGVLVQNNTNHGIHVRRSDVDLAIEGAVIDGNFKQGIDVPEVNNMRSLRIVHTLVKNNLGRGLYVRNRDTSVSISDSVFVNTVPDVYYPYYIGTFAAMNGIFLQMARKLEMTNTAIVRSGSDGLFVQDVPLVSLSGVDSTDNTGRGIAIRAEQPAAEQLYPGVSPFEVRLRDVRACRNRDSGISLHAETKDCGLLALAIDQPSGGGEEIVSCGNQKADYELGDTGILLGKKDDGVLPHQSLVGDSCQKRRSGYNKEQPSRCDSNYPGFSCQILEDRSFHHRTCSNTTKDCRGHRVILAADGTPIEDHHLLFKE